VTQQTEGASAQPGGRAALSRDLSDFLVELSIALHKHAMYPQGHPSLIPAADRVLQRLSPLLSERSTLALGVARDQLVIEGVATDAKNPVLKDLAGRLHRHELGAITFKRGVDAVQAQALLSVLAVEADRTGEPLGRGPSSQLTQWSEITLYPVTYEALEIVGDETGESDEAEQRESRTRAAALWVGLARAALALEHVDEGAPPPSTEPSVVAEAIDKHPGTGAYDQVIVGYLLKIAEELRTKKGSEAIALKNRMSKLVQELDKSTVQRLLAMGGDRAQRRQFLLNAAEGMAVDAVLDLVRAASEAHEQTISHSMLRMLTKMAQHAQFGAGQRREFADSAVRGQISDLIREWSLADPNPEAYRQALQRMSSAGPTFAVASEAQFKPEARRMLEMVLEVDETGEGAERAIDELIADGNLRLVVNVLHEADAPRATESLWNRLGTEHFPSVLRAEPIDAEVVDKILLRMGVAAIEPMLDALCESDSQQTRRVLIDRLVRMGSMVGPAVVARMEDPRWFVQRNMLAILGRLPELPQQFDVAARLGHEDKRVRREAVEVALQVPAVRERALAAALTDADDRIVRIGLSAAVESIPDTVLPLVVKRAVDGATEEQRLAAVRALATSLRKPAVEALLRMAAPRKSFLGWKLPIKNRIYLAALRALQSHKTDARVRQALDVAARSRDREIASAARGEREEGED